MADFDLSGFAGQLANIGLPALGAALGGPAGAALGKTVAGIAASVLGVEPTPEAVGAAIAASPEATANVVEALAPLEALYLKEAETLAEAAKPVGAWSFFKDGWRPAWSWGVGAIIIQSFVVAPWVAAFGYKSPSVPIENVIWLAGIWLTIYGGGHTMKAVTGDIANIMMKGRK